MIANFFQLTIAEDYLGLTLQTQISATEIAERAYAIWEANGCQDGHDVEDWLQAETELQSDAIQTAFTQSRISARAYAIWLMKGCPEGTAFKDWLQAEADLS